MYGINNKKKIPYVLIFTNNFYYSSKSYSLLFFIVDCPKELLAPMS